MLRAGAFFVGDPFLRTVGWCQEVHPVIKCFATSAQSVHQQDSVVALQLREWNGKFSIIQSEQDLKNGSTCMWGTQYIVQFSSKKTAHVYFTEALSLTFV